MIYEEKIFINKSTDVFEFSNNKWIFFDDILDIVYFNALYNIDDEKKFFFNYHKSIQTEEEKAKQQSKVNGFISQFNENIINDEYIKQISNDIENSNEFLNIFENINFKITTNVDHKNIFKSLDVKPFLNNEEVSNIGDGKNKILSFLLRMKSYKKNKEKIFIIEEPENHIYLSHQRDIISKFKDIAGVNSQIIFTTHSPFVIDFMKLDQIIKFCFIENEIIIKKYSLFDEKFKKEKLGYLFNTELAEMLFCEKVILIEGWTEKLFYNILSIYDYKFKKFLIENKIGILSVYGIQFKKIKKMLESFNIFVYIMTDNDLRTKNNLFEYIGLRRVYDYLSDNKKEEFYKNFYDIVSKKFKLDNSILDEQMKKIISFFQKESIFLPLHHDGFEGDYSDFIGINDFKEKQELVCHLKKHKLINLYDNIICNSEKMNINDKNKNNRLLVFYNE